VSGCERLLAERAGIVVAERTDGVHAEASTEVHAIVSVRDDTGAVGG